MAWCHRAYGRRFGAPQAYSAYQAWRDRYGDTMRIKVLMGMCSSLVTLTS